MTSNPARPKPNKAIEAGSGTTVVIYGSDNEVPYWKPTFEISSKLKLPGSLIKKVNSTELLMNALVRIGLFASSPMPPALMIP